MVHVKFKNMQKSELAVRIVKARITDAVARFPKGQARSVVVTLEMENSPKQAGPDLYKVRTEIIGGRYHGLILEKGGPSLYKALADVNDRLLERLNRISDRLRTKARKERREFISKWELSPEKAQGGKQ
jgi:ribosome-associated translation inhibitor RaiA